MRLVEAILEANVPYENKIVGAKIGEITWGNAQVMADLILVNAPPLVSYLNEGAPGPKGVHAAVCYLCAVMGQESRFDQFAFNRNLKPQEYLQELLGKRADPLKGDYGCAMFKGKYIIQHKHTPELHAIGKPILAAARDLDFSDGLPPANKPEVWMAAREVWRQARLAAGKPIRLLPQESRLAQKTRNEGMDTVVKDYLYRPEWAIPKMAQRYVENLDGARRVYPTLDPKDVATGIYNQGGDGYKMAVANPNSPQGKAAQRHIGHVRRHYEWFQKVLDYTEEA